MTTISAQIDQLIKECREIQEELKMKTLFYAKQFTPTKWESAEQKAKFANHMIRFIDSGFKYTLFHTWFYKRLSMTFGMIAHYNKRGFYYTWFDGNEREFIQRLLSHPCYGDPEYTYSDVEKALQSYIRAHYEG